MKCQQNITNIPIIKLTRQLKTNSTCSKIKISDTRTVQSKITVKNRSEFFHILDTSRYRIPYPFHIPDPGLFTDCHSQTENKHCTAFFPTSPSTGDENCIQAL